MNKLHIAATNYDNNIRIQKEAYVDIQKKRCFFAESLESNVYIQ